MEQSWSKCGLIDHYLRSGSARQLRKVLIVWGATRFPRDSCSSLAAELITAWSALKALPFLDSKVTAGQCWGQILETFRHLWGCLKCRQEAGLSYSNPCTSVLKAGKCIGSVISRLLLNVLTARAQGGRSLTRSIERKETGTNWEQGYQAFLLLLVRAWGPEWRISAVFSATVSIINTLWKGASKTKQNFRQDNEQTTKRLTTAHFDHSANLEFIFQWHRKFNSPCSLQPFIPAFLFLFIEPNWLPEPWYSLSRG